jgi:serine protease Do
MRRLTAIGAVALWLAGSNCSRPAVDSAAPPLETARKESSRSPAEVAPTLISLPSLASLVDAVKGAVVNVEVQSLVRQSSADNADFLERFFGLPPPGPTDRQRRPPQIRQGAGSGFIIEADGTLLTNNHVVAGADRIRVQLNDGRTFDGQVLGRDPLTDVAVVRLRGKVENLPVVKLGDSQAMRVGDWVVAIGNPFGLASSVSVGIVSAFARDIGAGPYDDFLQTDAAINPGNSGGPLFNLRGEVIGINTAIVGGGTGVGFAIPSNMAKALLPRLEKGQKIRRGWLGVVGQDLTPELAKSLNVPQPRGAVVADVAPDTPANKAGLNSGDVIVAVDEQPVESFHALTRAVGFKEPGTPANLTLYRNGKKESLQIVLGERPATVDRIAPGLDDDEASGEQKSDALGVRFEDVGSARPQRGRSGGAGALIVSVDPGSPADHADLRPGMVVVEAAGKPVRNAQDVYRVLREAKSGTAVLLRIEVQGRKTLRALPIP